MHREPAVAFALQQRLRKRIYVTRTLPVLHIIVLSLDWQQYEVW